MRLVFFALLTVLQFNCFAQISPALVHFKDYVEKPGARIVVSNMPRVHNQGTLPICYAMAASTIAQRHICKTRNINDCANIANPRNEISPLGMVAWARLQKSGEHSTSASFLNYIGLDLGKGGFGSVSLANASRFFYFPQASCYDFDNFVKHYGGSALTLKQVEEANVEWDLAYAELKYVYEKNQPGKGVDTARRAGLDGECVDCQLVNRDLLINIDRTRLADALDHSETFHQFLYRVIFSDCKREAFSPLPEFMSFPVAPNRTNKQQLLEKILEILKSDLPVQIEGVCMLGFKNGECNAAHAVVISGHSTVCKQKVCRPIFKLHNSWGEACKLIPMTGGLTLIRFSNKWTMPAHIL